jgi:bis(5'-nucleosyl)-tetraphosphatase (symmetrical)
VSTYAIGDVHGCSRTLRRLLEVLPFDGNFDRLWFVGDLVAHGPDSAGVLRIVRDLTRQHPGRVTVVLGNHDLRLLAARAEVKVPRKVTVLLGEVLDAEDGASLLDWLGQRPLLHVEGARVMVHAGLLPGWTIDDARGCAKEVESLLASPRRVELLRRLYEKRNEGESEPTATSAIGRAVRTAKVLTTLRTLQADGTLCDFNAEPEKAPSECRPWYSRDDRAHRHATIVFGHWAALGLRLGDDWIALDSGCAWGGPLSAVRLEDRHVFQTPRLD